MNKWDDLKHFVRTQHGLAKSQNHMDVAKHHEVAYGVVLAYMETLDELEKMNNVTKTN